MKVQWGHTAKYILFPSTLPNHFQWFSTHSSIIFKFPIAPFSVPGRPSCPLVFYTNISGCCRRNGRVRRLERQFKWSWPCYIVLSEVSGLLLTAKVLPRHSIKKLELTQKRNRTGEGNYRIYFFRTGNCIGKIHSVSQNPNYSVNWWSIWNQSSRHAVSRASLTLLKRAFTHCDFRDTAKDKLSKNAAPKFLKLQSEIFISYS